MITPDCVAPSFFFHWVPYFEREMEGRRIASSNQDRVGRGILSLVVVEPLKVGHAAAHVGVSDVVVRVGVAGDGGVGATRNDKNCMGIVGAAGARVVDEHITGFDVLGRSLVLTTGASPAVGAVEAVTEVLGAHLLRAARITTAGATLIQSLVATSEEALADKVGAITTVASVVAVLGAVVGPGGAGLEAAAALVVGAVPPLLGIGNSLVTIVSGSKTAEAEKSKDGNSLHVD